MYEKFVSRFLDKPFIYKLSEAITTPGGNNAIVAEFRKIIKTLPTSEKFLTSVADQNRGYPNLV